MTLQILVENTEALDKAVQKSLKIIEELKKHARSQHCFEGNENFEYDSPDWSRDQVFNAGTEYGKVTFARSLLTELGIKFECSTYTNS